MTKSTTFNFVQMKSSITALTTALNRNGYSMKIFEIKSKSETSFASDVCNRTASELSVKSTFGDVVNKSPLRLERVQFDSNDENSKPENDYRSVDEIGSDDQLNLEPEMVVEFEISTIDVIQNNVRLRHPLSDRETVAIVATYSAVDNFDSFRVCVSTRRRETRQQTDNS